MAWASQLPPGYNIEWEPTSPEDHEDTSETQTLPRAPPRTGCVHAEERRKYIGFCAFPSKQAPWGRTKQSISEQTDTVRKQGSERKQHPVKCRGGYGAPPNTPRHTTLEVILMPLLKRHCLMICCKLAWRTDAHILHEIVDLPAVLWLKVKHNRSLRRIANLENFFSLTACNRKVQGLGPSLCTVCRNGCLLTPFPQTLHRAGGYDTGQNPSRFQAVASPQSQHPPPTARSSAEERSSHLLDALLRQEDHTRAGGVNVPDMTDKETRRTCSTRCSGGGAAAAPSPASIPAMDRSQWAQFQWHDRPPPRPRPRLHQPTTTTTTTSAARPKPPELRRRAAPADPETTVAPRSDPACDSRGAKTEDEILNPSRSEGYL
ncbi:hypothetical protein HU200_055500 [Digitaria exilis]|uniref:Uncharacterized protein n=1 Tax=Digitaria exilis TaxID=1010633 RepID=A0A835AK58_9POAL|nr:hypothetical protein HU200_055500 [Digitaria exilis]